MTTNSLKTKLRREVVVPNRQGLHLRVSDSIMKKAKEFDSNIRLFKGNNGADGRRVIEIIALGAAQGDAVTIEAEGVDAQEALDAILELFAARFDED